ncbi:MAG: hypothetical protein E7647_02480 [Ruminococcaceae bacterium]|nr:hypothetical protein [Oscillospiraceae bacterium]
MIEDVIKLGLLIIVIVCSYLSSRWVLNAVYRSAGLTKEEVFSYRASVSRSKHSGRRLNSWILQNSKNPSSTQKYINLYTFATAAGAFYASLTFIAIIVDSAVLFKIHIAAGIALLLFYAFLFVSGNQYKKAKEDKGSIKSDTEDYVDFIKRKTEEEREKSGAGKKNLFVGIIELIIIIGLMVFIVVAVTKCTNAPMTATSYSAVWDAAEDMDCLTFDTLEKYRADWKDNEEEKRLLKALSADKNGLVIEYFEFLEDTYAKNIMSQWIDALREKEGYDEDRETLDSRGNYNIFVYSNEKTVLKMYRVDKTLLIIQYPKNEKPAADEFLVNIGYKDE